MGEYEEVLGEYKRTFGVLRESFEHRDAFTDGDRLDRLISFEQATLALMYSSRKGTKTLVDHYLYSGRGFSRGSEIGRMFYGESVGRLTREYWRVRHKLEWDRGYIVDTVFTTTIRILAIIRAVSEEDLKKT